MLYLLLFAVLWGNWVVDAHCFVLQVVKVVAAILCYILLFVGVNLSVILYIVVD